MPTVRKRAEKKSGRSTSSGGARDGKTRENILDATAQVLTRKGFSGTRLTDVAEVAGLQAPGIYYYFPSREDLIEEVVRRGQVAAREHVTAALQELPSTATALDRVTAAVEAHLRSVIELSDYTTAAIRNIGQLPAEIRSKLMKEQAEYGKVWQALFQDAADAGYVTPGVDLFAARMLVIGAVNWVPEWWNADRDDIDTVVTATRNMLLGVLAGGTPEPEPHATP